MLIITIQFSRNPAQLKKLKAILAKNKKSSSLFNGESFARHIESAYSAMHARCFAGLLPYHQGKVLAMLVML